MLGEFFLKHHHEVRPWMGALLCFLNSTACASAYYLLTNWFLCSDQMPGLGLSLTAVDSGLVSALRRDQTSLTLFLSSPDGNTVAGTGVILSYSSTGNTWTVLQYKIHQCASLLTCFTVFECCLRSTEQESKRRRKQKLWTLTKTNHVSTVWLSLEETWADHELVFALIWFTSTGCWNLF